MGFAGVGLDLDEGIFWLIGCYSKAKARAGFGGDAFGSPAWLVDDFDVSVADGFEGGEAALDLGDNLLFGGIVGLGEGECDVDAVARRDAGNSGARRVGIGRDRDGVDEAEIDDAACDLGVIAVAQGGQDVGFGESRVHARPDSMIAFEVRGLRLRSKVRDSSVRYVPGLYPSVGYPPGGVVLSCLFTMICQNCSSQIFDSMGVIGKYFIRLYLS